MNITELNRWQGEFMTNVFAKHTQDHDNGMTIYRNNLVLTHRASLVMTFPKTCALLGDNVTPATHRFLTQHGKSTYDWAEIGAEFPAYLAAQPELSKQTYLSSVAQYEWGLHRLNRATHKPLNQSSIGLLQTHAWHELFIDLAPGWQLFYSEYDSPAMVNDNANAFSFHTIRTWVCWRSDIAPQTQAIAPRWLIMYQHAATYSIHALSELATQHDLPWLEWLEHLMHTQQLYGLIHKPT